MKPKKFFHCLLLAAITLLAVVTISCSRNEKKVAAAVSDANSECPMSVNKLGKCTAITYDKKGKKVVFCLKVGFNERQTATLISGKPLFYEGELYSEEHRRKFTTEEAGFQVVKDPKDKSKLALAINGQVIGEWFKEQFGRLFSSVKRTVEPLRRGKGMEL